MVTYVTQFGGASVKLGQTAFLNKEKTQIYFQYRSSISFYRWWIFGTCKTVMVYTAKVFPCWFVFDVLLNTVHHWQPFSFFHNLRKKMPCMFWLFKHTFSIDKNSFTGFIVRRDCTLFIRTSLVPIMVSRTIHSVLCLGYTCRRHAISSKPVWRKLRLF